MTKHFVSFVVSFWKQRGWNYIRDLYVENKCASFTQLQNVCKMTAPGFIGYLQI